MKFVSTVNTDRILWPNIRRIFNDERRNPIPAQRMTRIGVALTKRQMMTESDPKQKLLVLPVRRSRATH